jgi:hypothetical protein
MNITDNRISAEVLPETEDRLNQNIDGIETDLPFLIDLPVDEKRRLSKLGRKRVDFVDRGVIHIKASPEYLPSYRPLDEFLKDVALRDSLHRIHRRIKSLEKRLRDTILLVESEAYAATRIFYNSVQTAARSGSKDAELIANDLAFHFKRKPSTTTTKPDTNTDNTTTTDSTADTSTNTTD